MAKSRISNNVMFGEDSNSRYDKRRRLALNLLDTKAL